MPLTEDELKRACHESLTRHANEPTAKRWHQAVVEFIEWARTATPHERRSIEFQRRLWNDNPVAATGQGQISVDAALEESNFRDIVAKLFEQTATQAGQSRTDSIRALFEGVTRVLKPHINKMPWLKVLRVFAIAFPTEFTSIAHRRRLGETHRGIGGPRGRMHVVDRSRAILDILDRSLGPVNSASLPDVATRLILPWWLYVDHLQGGDEDATETVSDSPGDTQLNPLPAARRRRGMLAIGGYVDTVLAILEFVKDGCERDDLREHIRSINPNLSERSVPTNINALIAEWGVLRSAGSHIELTDRGAEFLDSGDPIELSDWLLTRVLGFDYLLWHVKRNQPLRKLDAAMELKTVNPGWTSNYAPDAMTNWQIKLGLLERLPHGMLRLSKDGEQWSELITWTPEKLEVDTEDDESDATDDKQMDRGASVRRPTVEAILQRIAEAGVVVPDTLVATLHFGLWAREIRHFAVLSGLSGAGKTMLARAYGAALNHSIPSRARNLITVAVQPGWYDPSAILGYVNPLNEETYVSTHFLRFLMQAASDPEVPYTVVFDEMNLSHPEQYLAPLFSAMETGSAIHLHSQGGEVDGIPGSIPYPRNLVIIGTVNMDETTQGLSDKVLDRAFVREFWDVDVADCPRWKVAALDDADKEFLLKLLSDVMDALRPVRLHFGWRVIEDVLRFAELNYQEEQLTLSAAADAVVYAKVVPKLRGDDSPSLRTALAQLQTVLERDGLADSARKVGELLLDLEHTGTARFWR